MRELWPAADEQRCTVHAPRLEAIVADHRSPPTRRRSAVIERDLDALVAHLRWLLTRR